MQIDVTLGREAKPLFGAPSVVAPAGLCEGANVRVAGGWRRVEFLRQGDLVATRDCGLQPLRLIWIHEMAVAEMCADPSAAPVRLPPRVMGPMMPRRALRLGGGQRVVVPSCRISGARDGRGRALLARDVAERSNGAHVDLARPARLHVLVFDAPQVVSLEGLWIESFCASPANVSALDEAGRADLLRLWPELGRAPGSYPPSEYTLTEPGRFIPQA